LENKHIYHIIGAGIAGLYCAKLIKKHKPKSKVIVYEASEKIGGRCGSTFYKSFNCMIDNASHVILNYNKYACSLINKKASNIRFWSKCNNKFVNKFNCLKEIELAIFNTINPDWRCRLTILRKLFPFIGIKAFFSDGNLEDVLCKPLLKYVDEIKFGYVWVDIKHKDNLINELIFNKENIVIKDNDIIISAIDSYNYNKIIGGYDFEYNTITNIYYRTSMALTLPENQKILGIKNGKSHWIFSGDNYIAVTISDANKNINVEEIWQEICDIRNYNSAFLPQYITLKQPRATIKQDDNNNSKRPSSAISKFDNMFICGDWTMKNYPCCIESAIVSAIRARRNCLY